MWLQGFFELRPNKGRQGLKEFSVEWITTPAFNQLDIDGFVLVYFKRRTYPFSAFGLTPTRTWIA